MSKYDEPYGFKIIYKDGNSEIRWFQTKADRDYYFNLMKSSVQHRVKSVKKKER